jgi:hypothetical protein
MTTTSVDAQKVTMDLLVTTDCLEKQIHATQKLFLKIAIMSILLNFFPSLVDFVGMGALPRPTLYFLPI